MTPTNNILSNMQLPKIIELIVDLFDTYEYPLESAMESPDIACLIEAGYLSLDEATQNCKINIQGKNAFHPYIESISLDYIEFMKENRYWSSCQKTNEWCSKKYNISLEKADDIITYITKNLAKYKFIIEKTYDSKNGWAYVMRKEGE